MVHIRQCTCFWSTHETSMKTDHVFCPKSSANEFQNIKYSTTFSKNDEIKLAISVKHKTKLTLLPHLKI